jgi:hypothetical protein
MKNFSSKTRSYTQTVLYSALRIFKKKLFPLGFSWLDIGYYSLVAGSKVYLPRVLRYLQTSAATRNESVSAYPRPTAPSRRYSAVMSTHDLGIFLHVLRSALGVRLRRGIACFKRVSWIWVCWYFYRGCCNNCRPCYCYLWYLMLTLTINIYYRIVLWCC